MDKEHRPFWKKLFTKRPRPVNNSDRMNDDNIIKHPSAGINVDAYCYFIDYDYDKIH
jgi:hypothetical protein